MGDEPIHETEATPERAPPMLAEPERRRLGVWDIAFAVCLGNIMSGIIVWLATILYISMMNASQHSSYSGTESTTNYATDEALMGNYDVTKGDVTSVDASNGAGAR